MEIVRLHADSATSRLSTVVVRITVIEAREKKTPPDRERIDWKLITDLTVDSLDQAIEKVQWYGLRWKIEIFHKILKSGCRAEQSRLRTTARLTNLLAVFCILSWRVFWLTMIHRVTPEAGPELIFTDLELRILDKLVHDKPAAQPRQPGRLPSPQFRSSTRKRNHLESFISPRRHSTRRRDRWTTYG